MKISHKEGGGAPRRRSASGAYFVACAAALCLVLAAYSNSLENSFHFDDYHVIEENVFIRDLANVGRFFTDARTFSSIPTNATYRPIVSLTLALDHWRGGGLTPRAFHVTQIFLLLVIGAMLTVLFGEILDRSRPSVWNRWTALVASTLFCVHTGNTQPINYISARSELLAAIGILGALLIYSKLPRARRFQLHLLPIAFGTLAKTPAVIAAPLLLAYSLLFEHRLSFGEMFARRAWPRVKAALLSTAIAFVFAAALYVWVEGMNPPGQTYGGGGRIRYLMTETWVWVHYARLFLLPTGLSADTDLDLFASAWDPRVIAGVVFALVMAAAAWRASRRDETRAVAFGIAWFAIGLVPSSTILPLAEVANDHRVFFPFMGLCLAATSWLGWRFERGAVGSHGRVATVTAGALALCVLAAHAVGTHRRNRDWRSEETLWADVVRKSPANGRGWMNYGLTQMSKGRYEEAKRLFERARALLPNYSTLEVNLGIVENGLGNPAAADSHFTRALELNPNHPATHRYYARWLIAQGRGGEAQVHVERSIELSPADIEARHLLMSIEAARGAPGLLPLARETLGFASGDTIAQAYARGAPPFHPAAGDAASWYRLGLELNRENDHLGAAQAYRASLARDATNGDAWNNLGWSLGKLGCFDEAVAALVNAKRYQPADALVTNNLEWVRGEVANARFKRALALQRTGRATESVSIYHGLLEGDPNWVNAHYNLGFALMSLGRHAEAIAEFRRTLELSPDLAEAHLHLANTLSAMGRPDEAERERTLMKRVTPSRAPRPATASLGK
jgi:protein O-mannosyl-transferase